jgi:hypothetical protein
MESKLSSNKFILPLLVFLSLAMAYLIFSSQSNIKDALLKIGEVRMELNSAKDSLAKSGKQVNEMILKIRSAETNLNIIRSQVQSIDFNYRLSKATSGSEIKAIKEKIEKENEEQQRLIEELKKLQ